MIIMSVALALALVLGRAGAYDFFHQSPEQHKLTPGWQEPGLWRPRWIMDRVFYNDDDEEEYRDRIHFKLKIDRTIEVVKSERRPWLLVGSKSWPDKGGGNGARRAKQSKKLFEVDNSESEDLLVQRQKLQAAQQDEGERDVHDVDGTWWWADASPMNYAKVKLETRETGEDGGMEKVRHEVLSDWGTLDGYAFNFRRGKVIKPRKEAGIPVGSRTVGLFTIKVSPHRPMVSKDFMAFQ